MIKKIFVAIFLINLSYMTSLYGNSREQRRNQIIQVIDQELREVTRLNNQAPRPGNPEHFLRMAELLLEKARHLKDAENDRFMRLSPEERSRINRQQFFNESTAHFTQAQRTCQHILQNFPRYRDRAEVYYIMAYNSKEFQREQEAERYFRQAIRDSRPGSPTRAKSQLGLAEILYNRQDFRGAVPLYTEALRQVDDQWWTKDSYNLAWSLFRVNRQDEAIRLMHQVLERSKNPKYVDMTYSVQRDLAYFYTEMGRIDEAVRFYQRQGGEMSSNLLRVGRHLETQGKHTAAIRTFEEALNHRMTREDEIEVHVRLLPLYEQFNNYEKHLNSSRVLAGHFKNGHLRRDQAEVLLYQVQLMSSKLQKQVASRDLERHADDRTRRGQLAVAYFQLFGELDASQSYKSNFHSAETLFATGRYDEAVRLYDLAIRGAREANDRQVLRHALDGMMASLGQSGISQASLDQYLEPTYLAFLQANPRGDESNRIFQRLFNRYMDAGDTANAERTLNSYRQNFPNERGTQEAMIAKLMDHYKDTGNTDGVRRWVERINSGEFRVSRDYAEQVRVLLLSMQFNQVQEYSSRGDRVEALRGYVRIYQSDRTSADAKKNAAYNIATLFHELGDPERTYGWAKRAIDHMPVEDILKFEDSFLSMAVGLFNRRRIAESASLNTLLFTKLCQSRAKNKDAFFQNANVMHLAVGNRTQSLNLINSAPRCQISRKNVEDAQSEHLSFLLTNQLWSGVDDYINELRKNRANWPELIYPLSRVRDALDERGRGGAARQKETQILELYRGALQDKRSIPVEGLDVVARIQLRELERMATQLRAIQVTFPEEVYNQRLEQIFELLDRMTAYGLTVVNIGSGHGIVTTYRHYVEAYEYVANLINNFTPPDVSESYLTSFRQGMREITNPLMSQANEFRRVATAQINSGTILSEHNYWFLGNSRETFRYMYSYPRAGLIMDRGGRR